jgi:hypothetical protein
MNLLDSLNNFNFNINDLINYQIFIFRKNPNNLKHKIKRNE